MRESSRESKGWIHEVSAPYEQATEEQRERNDKGIDDTEKEKDNSSW